MCTYLSSALVTPHTFQTQTPHTLFARYAGIRSLEPVGVHLPMVLCNISNTSHFTIPPPLPWRPRYVGIRSLEPVGVHLPGDQNYPGGSPFDPLNFSGDADGFVDQVRGPLVYVCRLQFKF